MSRTRPLLAMPKALHFARSISKLALGLFFLSFFLGYQPVFGFPPIKKSIVYAQTEQAQTVSAESLPFSFQLPHPGYLTTHFSRWHPGIDIPTGFGMPIKPIAEGTVTNAQFSFFGYGMMVEVDHGHGYKSLYAHMNRMYVKNGDQVTKDSILGEVGLTGRTSGAHTHLEVSVDGVKIDPLTILPPIRQNPEAQDFVAHATVNTETVSGGPTKFPTIGQGKVNPTPKPEVKEEPKITQPLTSVEKLDVQKILTTQSPIKPSFLNF